MIVCTRCSTQNQDGDEFCGGCGEFLEWAGQKVEAAPEPPKPLMEPDVAPPPEPPVVTEPVVAPAPQPAPEPAPAAAPAPPQPEPVRPAPAQPEPVQPAAVLPSRPAPKRLEPAAAAAAEPALKPGELACPSCGAGNEAGRSFCRRCGNSLAPAAEEAKKPSWWRKLVTKDPKVHSAGDRPMRDKKGKFKP